MARKAAGFVGGECANLFQQEAAMRVVAIRARHRGLGEAVRMRPLERSPHTRMTASALLIDGRRFSGYQACRFRLVHPMTARTGHAAPRMTALDAADMSRLVAMAGEAGLIDLRGAQFHRVDDFIG